MRRRPRLATRDTTGPALGEFRHRFTPCPACQLLSAERNTSTCSSLTQCKPKLTTKLSGHLSTLYDVVNAKALASDCRTDMPVLWAPP